MEIIDLRKRKGTIVYGEDLFTQDDESYKTLVEAGYKKVTLLEKDTKYVYEGLKDPLYELKGFTCALTGSTYFLDKESDIKVNLCCRVYRPKKSYYYPNLGEKFCIMISQIYNTFTVQVTDYNRFRPSGFRYTNFFMTSYVDKDFINQCCYAVAKMED